MKRNNNFVTALSDCAVMTGRSVKHIFRNLDTLIMTMIVPIMILLVFTYLFGGAVDLGGEIKYINYVVPGILILSVGYSASTTSVGINGDFKKGIVDRFRSMPVARASFLVGHIIAALARNVLTTVLVVFFALILGFRSNAGVGEWAAVCLVLLFFALMVTSAAAMFGLLASSPDGAGIFGFVMMFLPYLSSAFVPVESFPVFLQGFSKYQPIGVVVDTVKAYLLGTEGGSMLLSAVWCSAIILVTMSVSVVLFMRKTTK